MAKAVFLLFSVIFTISNFSCGFVIDHLDDFKHERRNYTGTTTYQVEVNTTDVVATTDERFLSAALDTGMLKKHWERFHFHTVRMINMARALSPVLLRIGGTAADFSIFDDGHLVDLNKYKNFSNFTIYPEDIDNIHTFSQLAGWDVLYDLNVLLRSEDGSWNSSNSVLLMNYVAKSGYQFAWELGNEPNLFHDFNKSLDAVQLGFDYRSLRSILTDRQEFGQWLVGPAITALNSVKQQEYFESFIEIAGTALSAVTWHHYYLNGRIATLDQFYDPEVLDSVIPQMELIQKITAKYAPLAQVWLGETSSAYGGGAPGISNAYAAGFMWLDKLGLAALFGHKVVIRQTWFAGNYALLDEDLEPLPDYWSSVLHKKLVGSKVLKVKNGLKKLRKNRVYAHCTNTRNKLYQAGSVTLIALNVDKHASMQILLSESLHGLDVDEYLLTPAGNLTAKFVELNGSVLTLVNNTFLPEMKPKPIPPSQPIVLPPLSYGFYVIPQAKAVACMTKDIWN